MFGTILEYAFFLELTKYKKYYVPEDIYIPS